MTLSLSWPARPATLGADSDYVELFGGALCCWQPRYGYRFSVDSVLLAMEAFDAPGEEVLELGSGVGPVLLLLSLNAHFERLIGLELQEALLRYAQENARLRDLGARLRFELGDLRCPPDSIGAGPFGLVVSNPPYYPVSEGHVNPSSQRAVARHEVACTLRDVLKATATALRVDGRAIFVYPAPRASALLDDAPRFDLDVRRCCYVRRTPDYAPRQVLVTVMPVAARRGGIAPVPEVETIDLTDAEGRPVGRYAAFVRRLERLSSR